MAVRISHTGLPKPGTKQTTKWYPLTNLLSQLSTHEAHRVGNNVVFGHFTNFGGRSVIRDKHKCLAEHSWVTLDHFLVSRGRVCARPTAMRDISGDGDQERRGLAACLRRKRSCRRIAQLRAMCVTTHLESGGSRTTALRAAILASSL
jgi:hypothetical protein